MANFEEFCSKLQLRFLCCYPVANIDWQAIPADISWDQQEELIAATYGHKLNKVQPVKMAYQLNFLKRLLEQLEATVSEVHDSVYESYCDVQQQIAQDATRKFAYKHYVLPAYDATFSLLESKSFVAEGTTGLCSWQASLALADFFLAHSDLVRHRSVLELGAGTGLCGYILSGCCGVRDMLLTDGNAECVALMRETIINNFPHAKETTRGSFEVNTQLLRVKQLPWAQIEHEAMDTAPDLLIAADVVYDDRVFDELSHAVEYIFSRDTTNRLQMYLAATVRNEYTLQKFLHILEKLHFQFEECPAVSEEQTSLHWDRRTPVRILRITKHNS